MLLASTRAAQKPGVTMDYSTVNSGTYNNYVFQSDVTYSIVGPLTLNGVTIIQGSTVLKMAKNANAKLSIAGYTYGYTTYTATVVCDTAPYRMATITAVDDNSLGEGWTR